MTHKVRINCIEVHVSLDLEITYRLTLQIKPQHVELFDNKKWIMSYIKNNKIRYMICFETKDKAEVLKVQRAAQFLIVSQKIKEMEIRKDQLMDKLSQTV